MRKRALLYARVAVADKGENSNNLSSQKDFLVNYCTDKNIDIEAVFEDCFSGKTFDRPGFNELMKYAENNKGKIDYLLVKDWARFGRDYSSTLTAKEKLKSMGIEVQAVEQPVDSNNPEGKTIQALYLANLNTDKL